MKTAAERSTILILGAGLMQVPAFKAARTLGLRIIAADGNPQAMAAGEADEFHAVDIADPEALLAMAQPYAAANDLHAVFTAGTDFSASVAYVAEKLGLPGIGYETALDASIKSRMRARFAQAGVPSPAFVELVKSVAQPDLGHLRYPLVIKPVDNMGARGVRKILEPGELAPAVAEARRFSRLGRVIVEEFIDGPEYSIDGLVINGEVQVFGVADRHIHFPPYFVELGHTLPTSLNGSKLAELLAVFTQAAEALGIRTGAVKGDVFYSSRGPVIGEIAARLSGGYMSGWTYPLATGLDLTKLAIELALGRSPSVPPVLRHWTGVERALVSIPGQVVAIEGEDRAWTIPGVSEIFWRVKPGDTARFPKNNVEKSGNIIASAASRQAAVDAAESAVRAIQFDLEPNNPLTEAFLAAPCHFTAAEVPDTASPAAYPALAAWLSHDGESPRSASSSLSAIPDSILSEPGRWDYLSARSALETVWSDADHLPRWALSLLARGGSQALRYGQATLAGLSPAEVSHRQQTWSLP